MLQKKKEQKDQNAEDKDGAGVNQKERKNKVTTLSDEAACRICWGTDAEDAKGNQNDPDDINPLLYQSKTYSSKRIKNCQIRTRNCILYSEQRNVLKNKSKVRLKHSNWLMMLNKKYEANSNDTKNSLSQ